MFKIGQKVKIVVPTLDHASNKVFKGFVVTAVKESTSKSVELSYNKKAFYELFFHLDGQVKKANDSTLDCFIVDDKETSYKIKLSDGVEEVRELGKEHKNIFTEITDQYNAYVGKRKAESDKRKTARLNKAQADSEKVKI